MTYAELTASVRATADQLVAAGVGADSVVGLLSAPSAWLVAVATAVTAAGGAFLPLDRELPPARLGLLGSRASHLLHPPGSADAVARIGLSTDRSGASLAGLPTLEVDPFSGAGDVTELPACGGGGDAPSAEDALAYVVFTSGSTGDPKAVLIPRRGLANHLEAVVDLYGLSSDDALAFNAPLSFDVCVWQALTMARAGGRTHVLDAETSRDPEERCAPSPSTASPCCRWFPPSCTRCSHCVTPPRTPWPSSPAFCWMLVHGEALPPRLAERFFAHFPDRTLVNVYGPAECSDDVSIAFIRAGDRSLERSALPIGRPLQNTQLHVLDPGLRMVPRGVPGELFVAGAGLARGYGDGQTSPPSTS